MKRALRLGGVRRYDLIDAWLRLLNSLAIAFVSCDAHALVRSTVAGPRTSSPLSRRTPTFDSTRPSRQLTGVETSRQNAPSTLQRQLTSSSPDSRIQPANTPEPQISGFSTVVGFLPARHSRRSSVPQRLRPSQPPPSLPSLLHIYYPTQLSRHRSLFRGLQQAFYMIVPGDPRCASVAK